MIVREYITVRRAYNCVRRSMHDDPKIAFEEFAILVHLANLKTSLKTSEIADYQNVLRPTMTHRTNHLADLGFIEREAGSEDHRNVCCSISVAGKKQAAALCKLTHAELKGGATLGRVSEDRLNKYIDTMGEIYFTASDLILVCLAELCEGSAHISTLVEELGLLQPTVSMSVKGLVDKGMLKRRGSSTLRTSQVELTAKGEKHAAELLEQIEELVVRRAARS